MNDRTIPRVSTYDVVTFKLLANGKDITNNYQILSLTVNKEVNRISTARIVIKYGSPAEETFSASEGEDLIPGQKIEIAVGYDSNDRTIFQGIAIKQGLKVNSNGKSVLILDCKELATKLTIGRHSRYFSEITDSDALEEIIGAYSNLAADIESTQLKHSEIVQYYSTDWDFILSRAEMNGQIITTEDNKIIVKTPNTKEEPLLTLTYGSNLLEFEAEMDARFQYQAVKAKAWSYKDQELLEAEASEPSINAQGDFSGTDLAKVIDLTEWELCHGGLREDRELKAWADAQLLKSRLAKIRGRVKTKGYGDAKPDALINLQGLGKRFNGLAYVSGIRHELNGGAWRTYMQIGLTPQWFYKETDIVEQQASGLLPRVNGLQIGIVVQLQDDPDGEDRILVKAPIIDSKAEGIWARIATLDAGEQRGSFFRPEIGDEVVLGFLNDDPRDPIVLGMLNSSAKPAPLQATDENHQKGFVTRSQMKITFDDDKKVINIETPGKNKIIVSDEDKSIQMQDQNGNTLTMNESGIEMKSPKDITIEATGKLTLKATQDNTIEGMNVNVTANSQFKAQGNAGAEVSTSAIAVLKGSLVQIN